MEEVRIILLEERDQWEEAHREGGLPCHSWGYAWALSSSGVDSKLAVVRAGNARMLMPFFERDWLGTTDIATIVGLSGASITPASAAPLLLWREFAKAMGWIAGYIQLAVSVELDLACVPGQLATSNVIFVLDPQADRIFRPTSRSIKTKLRNAVRSEVVLIDDPVVLNAALQELYPATMQRVGAPPRYLFSSTTLERWVLDRDSLVLGAAVRGSIEAVYVFRTAGEYAESQILGTTEFGRELIPWLTFQGISRLRQQGVTMLNLGGGVRPGDGLYLFKKRLGASPRPLQAIHQIYDIARYEDLCRRADIASSAAARFPAYRAGSTD